MAPTLAGPGRAGPHEVGFVVGADDPLLGAGELLLLCVRACGVSLWIVCAVVVVVVVCACLNVWRAVHCVQYLGNKTQFEEGRGRFEGSRPLSEGEDGPTRSLATSASSASRCLSRSRRASRNRRLTRSSSSAPSANIAASVAWREHKRVRRFGRRWVGDRDSSESSAEILMNISGKTSPHVHDAEPVRLFLGLA
jgi:hypothetical protein